MGHLYPKTVLCPYFCV